MKKKDCVIMWKWKKLRDSMKMKKKLLDYVQIKEHLVILWKWQRASFRHIKIEKIKIIQLRRFPFRRITLFKHTLRNQAIARNFAYV